MKKIISTILVIMLASALALGTVAYADEEEAVGVGETEATEDVDIEAEPEINEESIRQYITYDFSDKNNIVIKNYITADEKTLDYFESQYNGMGYQVTREKDGEGNDSLVMPESQVTKSDLNYRGIDFIEKNGLFWDKYTYVYVIGDMTSNGGEVGSILATVYFDFGTPLFSSNADRVGDKVCRQVIVGNQNTVVANAYEINWINLLIALMILIVLILIVLIAVLSNKKKNEEENEEPENTLPFDMTANEEENAKVSPKLDDESVEIPVEMPTDEAFEETEATEPENNEEKTEE